MTRTAETHVVSGVMMSLVLEAMKQVSGAQYAHVLRTAGLERFVLQTPLSTPAPVATGAEISRLYATVFGLLGETLTRMFLNNYGRRVAERALALPQWQSMLTRVADVPHDQKLRRAAEVVSEQISATWTPTRVTEEAGQLYLVRDTCRDCAEIRTAQKPLCGSAEAVNTAFMRFLTGLPLFVVEVECSAAGGARCRFQIRR